MHRQSFALLVAAAAVVTAPAASAEEIVVLSSLGIKAVVEELAPAFERSTSHDVTTTFDLASTLKASIGRGARFDVAILTPPLLDDLIAKGLVAADSRTVVARVGLAFMIKAGAPKPRVGSVDEFKQTLLAARSVTYAESGASGVAFLRILDQLGIAAEVKAKARPAASGDEVNANVLSGAADLAVLPVSEILPVAGAELGGVFPDPIQIYVVMAAGVRADARSRTPKDFVAFLAATDNDSVVRAKGMQRVAADSGDARSAEVFAAERAFARSMAERDFAAFGRYVAEDTVFFSGSTTERGRDAVLAAWQPFFAAPTAPFSWEPDQVEVLESGDLALSTGLVKNPEGAVTARFNSIWQRQADGRWRVIFDKGGPP
jgi:molybdate transport system substrate-binding protein